MKKAQRVDVIGLALLVALIGCMSVSDRQETPPPTILPAASTPASEKLSSPSSSSKQQTSEVQGVRVQELSAREEFGQTIIDIKLSIPISQYRHFPIAQPPRIVLDIFGDGKALTDVETFAVASNLVGVIRLNYGEGYLRLNIDTTPGSVPPYVVTPEGGGLKIVVGGPDPKATAKRTLILVRDGKRVGVATAEARSSSGNREEISTKDEMALEAKKYTGQKLSLDFKDADIKNVFRLLADVSGLNIVVTNDVARKVTLRLVEVPWDQALDLLIDTNGLGKEQIGNVVRISTANQLKAERDQLAAAKKAEENLEPLQTVYFNINYAKVKDLEPKVKTLLTKRPDASLVVDERSNTIMVRDIKKVVEDVSTLIARLDTRTPQVLIESNLIETTPTFARALGNRLTFQLGGTTFSSAAGAGEPFIGNTAPFPNVPTGLGGTISIIQNSVGGIKNLANALEAAESEGNIRIISRPSVVTLNNVASTIRSERILRILLPTSTNIASGTGASAAGSAVATEKVPVGIILTVTPQVSSDGYVLMNINVKSSTLGTHTEGSVTPDELNREAVSNVLVRDGETIVLGGILKDTSQESERGIPYLKDVPILGWLFKSHRWQKDFEELMVFITPRITSAGSENLPKAEQLWREQMKKTGGDTAGFRSMNP
jgi:type IV pilus assembly protein PilQ